MFPGVVADHLESEGHDAVSVVSSRLRSLDDATLLQLAVDEARVLVTENFADFIGLDADRRDRDEPCAAVVFVRKAGLPRGGALGPALGRRLHDWSTANPIPFAGPQWL